MKKRLTGKNIIILLIIIIGIGAFLRIFPVRYDSVRMYDIQLVTQAFDIGDGVAKGDFSVFKMPVKYPYFFPYLLLFFYGIFYIFGIFTGLFSSASQFIDYIFFHLDSFYDWARILIGVFGIALIPLVYIVTSKVVALIDKKRAQISGLLAAFLMTFNLLHVHISHQERPHILVSFFIFLSFYLFILFLEKKSLFRSLLLGLSIGLAAGSLHIGLLALLFFLLIVVFSKFRALTSIKLWAGGLIFLIIFVLSYPYIFLAFNDVVDYWDGIFHLSVTEAGRSRDGALFFNELFKQIIVYQPILIFLFVVFLALWALWKRKIGKFNSSLFKQAIIGGFLFIIVYILVFGIFIVPYRRMLAPLIPFFCFLIGVLFSKIFYKFKKGLLRTGIIGTLILLLVFPLVQTIRLNYLMFQHETRGLAKDWIENNISESDLIAMEHNHIRFVPTKESLEFQLALEPDSISRKDKFLLGLQDEEYPEKNRSILRYWTIKHMEDNYQFLKEQRVKYFIISKSNINDISEDGLESKIIFDGGTLVKSFNPFIHEASLRRSVFPIEFKNPIIDLWALERLGPVIEIYKL